jgi:hypothetical protein
MSLNKIHLRKLLILFYLPPKQQASAVRTILRGDLRKASGARAGGGDFHTPFWADAKNHAFGISDLEGSTIERIAKNPSHRTRLYPQLKEGFLRWWTEKRRWRNEPHKKVRLSLPSQVVLEGINSVVKVDKLLTFQVGDSFRIVYPYFAEEPGLSKEAARIALWVLSQAFPGVDPAGLRVLDVLRSQSFGIEDVKMTGEEEKIFCLYYSRLAKLYNEIKAEIEV